ncbi:MAG: hypothetical protein RQ966_03545 [Acetobacteraceae bacterium]|nr:hypothetical protein [Acetobacteraceae bacterium]
MAPTPPRPYDPSRHESHLVAVFADHASAGMARSSVIAAGVAAELVMLMAQTEPMGSGERHPLEDLFVPEDDYHDYRHALGRGHVLIVVRPESLDTRDAAARALQSASPLDWDEQHRQQQHELPDPAKQYVNHANLSRADMKHRELGGHDETMLDMTGKPMTVRSMSDEDMEKAPFAPFSTPAHQATGREEVPTVHETPSSGTSYTHGVPPEIARQMSPEQQVMAQPHAEEVARDDPAGGTYLRLVNGQSRVGWRDPHPHATRIRSYVIERPTDPST